MRQFVPLGCASIFPLGRFALITEFQSNPAFSPTLHEAIIFLMHLEPDTANNATELITNDRNA